jgi:hypothetical protein
MNRPKPSRWKRLLRGAAFGFAALLTVLALTLTVISFQGRREWNETRKELLAKGEKLSRVELAPPSVPDERNFFADPIWRAAAVPPGAPPTTKSPFELLNTPLSDAEWAELQRKFTEAHSFTRDTTRSAIAYHLGISLLDLPPNDRREAGELLFALTAPLAEVPAKIENLLTRPEARFPFDYGGLLWKTTPYPGLNDISALLTGLAFVHLNRGEAAPAAQLAQDNLQLADTLAKDPILYTQMLRAGVIARATPIISAGLTRHLWSDTELASFQDRLDRIDLLPGMALAFRGERGFVNQTFEAFHRMTPRARDALIAQSPGASTLAAFCDWQVGPIRIPGYVTIFGPGDQALLNRKIQTMVEAIDRTPADGFHYENAHHEIVGLERCTHLFTSNFVYLLGNQPTMTAIMAVELRELATACALERYRLRHGEYPDRLEALVPTFLAAIPKDIFTRQPIRYRRNADGTFQLWAAGKTPEADIRWPQ